MHPKAAGLARIRVCVPRTAGLPGELLAVWDDGKEDQVGTATRTENKPGSTRGWQANLWDAHPSLAEGHITWKPTARELGKTLGPWWA
jgi:hypothetical protein